MNSHITKMLFVIAAVAQTAVMTMISAAHASEGVRNRQFYYNPSDSTHPLLDAPFDYTTNEVDGVYEERYGHLYIYCNKSSLKKFYFSSIIKTKIAEYFAKQKEVIIGYKSVSDNYDIPIDQIPVTESKQEGLKRLGFVYYEPIYLDEVRDFSPTHLSDTTSLYGRSYLDASILDYISKPTLVGIAYYEASEKRWYVISQVLIKTDLGTIKEFVTACTPKEQTQ